MARRFFQTLAITALIALAFSCAKKEVAPEQLEAFIRDQENGLLQAEEVNGTKVAVAYRPTDVFVFQEVEGEAFTAGKIDSLRKKYDPYFYFMVSLSRNDKEALHQTGGFGEYSDMVNTLSFKMGQYVTLTTAAHDTIPVADFVLNRTYGMSSSTDLLFVFDRKKAEGKDWIQFNLNEFGLGLGNQRFRFSTKDIEGAPRVRF